MPPRRSSARASEGGPFKDIFDFCERIDLKIVNQRGAGTAHQGGRVRLVSAASGRNSSQVVPRAISRRPIGRTTDACGQRNLFDASGGDEPGDDVAAVEALPDVPPWPETEKLKYEKEALDFYFSSHPLAQYEKDDAPLCQPYARKS